MANERVIEVHEDPSVLLHRLAGVEMASPQIALALAEMVFRRVYGDDDFQTQLPLNIEDGGDRWIIKGSRRAEDYPMPPRQASKGQVQIEILKSNCQIVRLTQWAQLPAIK
jgi:hypothetical protein